MSANLKCPLCQSAEGVRLLKDAMAERKYYCHNCSKPFRIPKTNKQIRKEHPPK